MKVPVCVLAAIVVLTGALSRATLAEENSRGDAVILLHGLGRGPWGMKVLDWRLERAGFVVHNLAYPTDAESIASAAEQVRSHYDDCCRDAPTLHFVTHSMGGIVLRALLADWKPANAGRAVMLAPPNRGSEIVDQIGGYRAFAWVLGPIAPLLGTGEEDLPSQLPPPPIPFGVIAGSRWINPLGPLVLPEPHDGTVSVASTRLDGMSDHLIVSHNHTFIVNSAQVTDEILHFLRDGKFSPSGRMHNAKTGY